MANKSIYIKDEDVALWNKARELAGESLSQLLTNSIKNFVATKEAEKKGFKEKIILRYRDRGILPVAKSFYGRWLIPLDTPYKTTTSKYPFYTVAITSKNNVVIFGFSGTIDKNGECRYGEMYIYSSFDEAAYKKEVPDNLLAAAVRQMGVEVEELDI